jgi:hypothetical protein
VLYVLAADSEHNNYKLDFNFKKWNYFSQFLEGIKPTHTTSYGSRLWAVGSSGTKNCVCLYKRREEGDEWTVLRLSVQITKAIAMISNDDQCIILQPSKMTSISEHSAEETPTYLYSGALKSTINLFKGNYYYFEAENAPPSTSSQWPITTFSYRPPATAVHPRPGAKVMQKLVSLPKTGL